MSPIYRFTIFLPVRNGGKHFHQCVLSILAQTYRNFELVVLDNASTDGSLEWIRAIQDPRVSVYESTKPLSIEENWARIMAVPKNEFMTMTGHDDLFDPNYLEVMCRLIDSNPDAGLYQAHFRLIDADGKKIRSCVAMPAIEKADAFLTSRLSFRRDSFGTGYLFRSTDYERVGGIPGYKKLMFADDALWLRLMKDSYKATSVRECFSYRKHSQSTSGLPDWKLTHDALDDYLDLLGFMGEQDQQIGVALRKGLRGYMVYWYQWAYLSLRQNEEKENVARTIKASVLHVVNILIKLGVQDAVLFELEVRKYVFGYLSRYYLFADRLRTWCANNIGR